MVDPARTILPVGPGGLETARDNDKRRWDVVVPSPVLTCMQLGWAMFSVVRRSELMAQRTTLLHPLYAGFERPHVQQQVVLSLLKFLMLVRGEVGGFE